MQPGVGRRITREVADCGTSYGHTSISRVRYRQEAMAESAGEGVAEVWLW